MNRASISFVLGAAAGLGALSGSALGALSGSANLTPSPLGGGQFHYDVSLHNTGSTTVGTLWLGWLPDVNFMGSEPMNVDAPSGWIALVTHNGAGDGYGIEFYTLNSSLFVHSGATLLGFGFDSAASPGSLATNSPFYGGIYQSLQSYLYIGFPENDAGFSFVATVTPTPTTLGVLALGLPLALRRRRRA